MEAEQLIQEKEWSSLTEAERAIILPLAADEQEFNLLKKMLLVAQEQLEEVPPLSPGVHQRLREAMAQPRPKTFRLPRWTYAAAAAVLIMAVAGWIFLHQTAQKPRQQGVPGYVHLDNKTVPTDTTIKSTQPQPPPVVKIVTPSTRPRAHRSNPKINTPSHLPADQPAIALTRINTSVGANGPLLDLVAEAY